MKNPSLSAIVRAATFLLIVGGFAIAIPSYFSLGNVYAIFEGVALVGIVALGLSVTMLLGELDLSVASVAACAGILAILLAGLGPGPAVLLATGGAILFGLLQGAIIAALRISSLVFTLGTGIVLSGVAFKLANEQTVTLALEQLDISSAISQQMLAILSPFSIVTILAFLLIGLWLHFFRSGREIYALGGGRNEAIAAGVGRRKPFTIAFGISAGLAGLGGALSALKSGGATPLAFDGLLLAAVTAALIGGISLYGGRGSPWGVFLGAITVQALLAGLAMLGASFWAANLASGALLLIFIVLEIFERRRGNREYAPRPMVTRAPVTTGGTP